MARCFESAESLADVLVCELRGRIVLGLPLGLGKANKVANALYRRAAADASIQLRIFTALTLEKPAPRGELEKRFLTPVIERLFGDYPELEYAKALRADALPPNIEISEFFFLAGRWLSVSKSQQSYISTNYTDAADLLLSRGINVIGQLVARRRRSSETRYSLSCNTDVTLDVLAARAAGKARFLLVGEVNSELPFMLGDADLASDTFDFILDDPSVEFPLFAPPKEPLSFPEYATGFHVARLIPDGGTLQIGIGTEGDATVHALCLRQQKNARFLDTLRRLGVRDDELADAQPFDTGVYAATEMLVDGLLRLKEAGVLKREVNGALAHAAFFLGPQSFYRALRDMPDEERAKFQMKPVSFTNQLYGDEPSKQAARVDARFINSTMTASLLGEAASDTLNDGIVVSGVGGQHNFVAQAFALSGARSILTLKGTRLSRGALTTNIRWSVGHPTIPRHLRDIFITEYGVADLRGKSDAECIAAMLSIADSRFQPELLRQAKDARKLPTTYEIPAVHRKNTPEKINEALRPLREDGFLPLFPLGTDLSETELHLIPALSLLNEVASSPREIVLLLLRGMSAPLDAKEYSAIARLDLQRPASLREWFYRLLISGALVQTR